MADSPTLPSPSGAGIPGTTDSREPAEQLRWTEQQLAAHVENTPLVVIEWDHEVRVTRWNAQAERMFGWTAAEVIGKGLFDWPFILDENRELAQRMKDDAVAGREHRSIVTTANRTRSGGIVWCEWYNSILYDAAGRMVSALSLGLDVTERRATAEALAFSQARVHAALDSARMLAWDLDLVTNHWGTTADVADFFGVEPGQDYSSPELALHAIHPNDVPTVLAGRQKAIESGEPLRYEFRGRVPAPDGLPRWFSTRGQVLRDSAGKAVRIVAVTTDVTERKRAEEKFRGLLESAPDGMLIVDDCGKITLVNSQAEQLFGYRREELLGQAIEILVPEQYRQIHPAQCAAYLQNPLTRPMGVARDLSGRKKDGRLFPVEISLSPLVTGCERLVICAVRDVTERKRVAEERETLNRQLQDAQRWESLGVLAGGVAHDFNNILTVVLGSAGLASRGLPPGSPALVYLDQIEQACRRAADVCRQMLAYAGRAAGVAARTQLAALVRESTPLLQIPAAHAMVRLALDDSIPLIPVDPAQVRQVLMSLATNAAEATPPGGEIIVRTHIDEVSEAASDAGFQLAPPPGRYVVLTVSDTGCGMTADVRARMFDPFFTTKFAGRGLGLAAVLGIVRAHKGGIRVSTAPGKGTTISVYWPPCSPDLAPVPVTTGAKPVAAASPAALVIDDEMFVREVTASTLEEMGYAPLLAADGLTGLSLFQQNRDRVKLAVIDVMMPGMTGDQVLETLRTVAPTLPVVLMSGFTDRRVIKAGEGTKTEFLQKPFHPEDLMALVRRLVTE
jgi:PAS domain S-box-containing protein